VDLEETGREGVDWVDLAYNRDKRHAFTDVVTNVLVPLSSVIP
jgi:hypothetical protein